MRNDDIRNLEKKLQQIDAQIQSNNAEVALCDDRLALEWENETSLLSITDARAKLLSRNDSLSIVRDHTLLALRQARIARLRHQREELQKKQEALIAEQDRGIVRVDNIRSELLTAEQSLRLTVDRAIDISVLINELDAELKATPID